MTFNEYWAAQLRAGALEIAENAEKIVGDLDHNQELTVTIHLQAFQNEKILWPHIQIFRQVASPAMTKVLHDYYNSKNK